MNELPHLAYQNDELCMDGLNLRTLAETYQTPLYVYSQSRIQARFHTLQQALDLAPEQLFYGVKANSSLAVIQVLDSLGAGFDVVSAGELERVRIATGRTDKIVFSGVGKTAPELRLALSSKIFCINVESEAELAVLGDIATEMQLHAPVSLRVNPDILAGGHPYIQTGLKDGKFGVDASRALQLYEQIDAHPYLNPLGIDCHLGSQIDAAGPMLGAAESLLDTVDTLTASNIHLQHIDLGGGFGVRYNNEAELDLTALASGLQDMLRGRQLKVLFEPGRFIVADAGILLTRVIYTKENGSRHFTIVDAAMNDLLRPALYNAYHKVWPLRNSDATNVVLPTDLVGPICESGDFLARDRSLLLESGDYVALGHAGAYGAVMSSNYNSRYRSAEVMISDGTAQLVRRRETLDDLLALELPLPTAEN